MGHRSSPEILVDAVDQVSEERQPRRLGDTRPAEEDKFALFLRLK